MRFKVPLFDLNYDEKESQAVLEVLKSKWISSGPKTKEFETKFANLLGTNHALATTNCTAALHMAMKILGIDRSDEVICPSLTFTATANAIRYVNAKPVFADVISAEFLTIDPLDIERKINSRTKAIIVMHYGGFACDMSSIMEIASRHNLKVIEDACHGPLSSYKGRKLGTIGDLGCFSFFSNKNISTGEGGMLITNKSDYSERARLLRSHGMTTMSYERAKGHSSDYDVVELGYNYRMDDIRASIGIVQLEKLAKDIEKRKIIRNYYIQKLNLLDDIIIPFKQYSEFSSNYIFPIIIKNASHERRNKIRGKMADMGIQTSIHYPAVHRFTIYKDYSSSLPITESVADSLITLPMYSDLEEETVDDIVHALIKALNEV